VGRKYKLWGKKSGALIALVAISVVIILPLLIYEYIGRKCFGLFEWTLDIASQQGEKWIFPILERCKQLLVRDMYDKK